MAAIDRADDILAQAHAIAHTTFAAPIWDPGRSKWFRAMRLSTGQVDTSPHYYYDLCNIYALGQARRLGLLPPELVAPWEGAAGSLFWTLNQGQSLGYAGLEVRHHRDRYSFALTPAALAMAFLVTGRQAFLERAVELGRAYGRRFPPGSPPNVQASHHWVLSCLTLHQATQEAEHLRQAVAEGEFLLASCRFGSGSAQGCFTDDFRTTAFPRHCYGAWAMTALLERDADERWLLAARQSLDWWRQRQLPDGGFHFFFEPATNRWVDPTVYSVHQKGMFLHSAWAIDRHSGGAYRDTIARAMACCDDPAWRFTAPAGWSCWRRSAAENDLVYAYELGWEVLGLALGHLHLQT